MARDLQADLELIRRTTPGEWFLCPDKCGPEGQGVYHRETLGKICEVGDPYPRSVNRPQENMEFIVEAHNGGWEEAIQRALAAEARVAELEARLARLKRVAAAANRICAKKPFYFHSDWFKYCWYCSSWEPDGHKDDCAWVELRRALRRTLRLAQKPNGGTARSRRGLPPTA